MVQRPPNSSGEALDQLFRELETPVAREVMWHSYSRLCNGIARAHYRPDALGFGRTQNR